MNIVETACPVESQFQPVRFLVGEKAEVDTFKEYMGSLALGFMYGAESYNSEYNEAAHFLQRLITSTAISANDDEFFVNLFELRDDLAGARIDSLIDSARKGNLLISQLSGEIDGLDYDTAKIQWTTKEGYNKLAPDAEAFDKREGLIDAYGEDSSYYQVACEHDLTHFAFQAEVIQPEFPFSAPTVLSDREHVTLGRMQAGEFIPVVTVLDDEHPAVGQTIKHEALQC